MDDISTTLYSVTSDVEKLNLEAADIEQILQTISSSCASSSVSSTISDPASCFAGRLKKKGNMTDSSSQTISCTVDQQASSIKNSPSLTLESLKNQRKDLAQALEMGLQYASGVLSSETLDVRLDANSSQRGDSVGGLAAVQNIDGLQGQFLRLQELDKEIATLKAQFRILDGTAGVQPQPSTSNTSSTESASVANEFPVVADTANRTQRSRDYRPNSGLPDPTSSIISFSSSMESSGADEGKGYDQLGHKVEMVYSLLSMLSSNDRLESSRTLLLMSRATDTSELMRQSGCVGHLIQLLHPGDVWTQPPTKGDIDVLTRAAEALHNLVQNQSDEKRKRRETTVLNLLDQIRSYSLSLRLLYAGIVPMSEAVSGQEVCPSVATLMRLSFDEDHRKATRDLGGLQAIAEMLICDQLNFTVERCPESNLAIRRYVGMALTNLTFGDIYSKHTLCGYPRFLETVNAQINSPIEDLAQVYSSVVRNLSWKADSGSKKSLREANCVTSLIQAAMQVDKESSLKSILSALWNLSAHCSENKGEICRIPKVT